MDLIIARIYKILKETDNLIEFEEQIQLLMHETFTKLVGDVFNQLNPIIKEQKQDESWTVSRNDEKGIIFMFGEVRFKRTLMQDLKGESRYPLDEWLGFRKRQRLSPFVEVKVAELASENDYRSASDILKEWTAVDISHTTVGNILKRVGEAQADTDREMIENLEQSDVLPEARRVDTLYTEADGVFVRSTKKKKHIEVSHAIMYEGWEKNGNRVALKDRKVLMTTNPIDEFWSEVQASAAHLYALENAQIVSNSDGGIGYSSHRFKEAFSQSSIPLIHQLDAFHVEQAIGRTFGYKSSEYKRKVQKAIETKDIDLFTLWVDTFESTLDEDKHIKKVGQFRTYIQNHWEYIGDWRKRTEKIPKGARRLGAMESNQRNVSFRMKRRGMHWSHEGAEAMVKVKQGRLNGTLREVYLLGQRRSARKQRTFKRTVHMSNILRQKTRPSVGVKVGSISVHAAHSSAIGRLAKSFS